MLVTYYDAYNVLSKVYSKGSFIKQALLNTQVEPLNKARVTKICYGVLDKDITLNFIISKFCQKAPKLAVKTLLKIGIYSLKYLGTPPHLVTDTLVELCKKLGKQGVSGFLNAVLRRYVREGCEIPQGNGIFALSINYSCPEFIVKKLINSYGLDVTKEFLAYDKERTFIRFNDGVDGLKYLEENNVKYYKTPYLDTFEVEKFTLSGDFYDGVYTFQSIGSRAICALALGGDSLLDCCSAPGGKAVKLSSIYKTVTACDIHEHRVELIKSYATRMNKPNVNAIVKDATVYDEAFDSRFDTVLCDVVCSGSGVMKDNPDIKLNRTDNDILELSKLQLKILKNASRYVKKGGELIYSTCSVLSEENDLVIAEFLKENSGYTIENLNSELNCIKTEYGLQFLPHVSQGAGFYACKIKRL
ncbi:MAG: methyltransferase domain-containing protein [Clostridia bacterium]|nr:methyltransferase domain-containing protein [Clostridia bacterium]